MFYWNNDDSAYFIIFISFSLCSDLSIYFDIFRNSIVWYAVRLQLNHMYACNWLTCVHVQLYINVLHSVGIYSHTYTYQMISSISIETETRTVRNNV